MKRYSILIGCFAILTSLSLGMDLIDAETSFPHPPSVITLDDYASTLACEDSIEGWGAVTGNFGSWYQLTANKNRMVDNKGNILTNLSFLCLTPNPIVDGNRLRADYYFPAPSSSFDNGPATLSLYHAATKEQLIAASHLAQASATELTQRVLQWQNDNYKIAAKPKQGQSEAIDANASGLPLPISICRKLIEECYRIWDVFGEMTLELDSIMESSNHENDVELQMIGYGNESMTSTPYSPEVIFASKTCTLYAILIMATPYVLG